MHATQRRRDAPRGCAASAPRAAHHSRRRAAAGRPAPPSGWRPVCRRRIGGAHGYHGPPAGWGRSPSAAMIPRAPRPHLDLRRLEGLLQRPELIKGDVGDELHAARLEAPGQDRPPPDQSRDHALGRRGSPGICPSGKNAIPGSGAPQGTRTRLRVTEALCPLLLRLLEPTYIHMCTAHLHHLARRVWAGRAAAAAARRRCCPRRRASRSAGRAHPWPGPSTTCCRCAGGGSSGCGGGGDVDPAAAVRT
jgi:hypothetical protein